MQRDKSNANGEDADRREDDLLEIVVEEVDAELDDQAQILFYRSTTTCTTTC